MAERKRPLQLSPTSLVRYQECPRMFYLYSQPSIPKITDYPRECGSAIHEHIYKLHQVPTSKAGEETRSFFYKNIESAEKAWSFHWFKNIDQAKKQGKLIDDKEKDMSFWAIGKNCVNGYWQDNINLPRPLAFEKRMSVRLPQHIKLLGIMDQLRQPPFSYIQRHRPELIENGKLREGYDPVVIVDFKSGVAGYDLDYLKRETTTEEKIRRQFELHENLQATTYLWLYEQVTGKKPIGFGLYHLRSRKIFFTKRDDRDFKILGDVIDHVIDNLNSESFPKNIGKHCERCDFMAPCREDRPFLITVGELPELPGLDEPIISLPTNVKKEPHRQLRFKMPIPRIKKEEPEEIAKLPETITLRDLPWDDPAKRHSLAPKA